MKPPIQGGTILVTGASSGIGREVARQLAEEAGTLVLVARRRDRLEALRDELLARRPDLRVSVKTCDLCDRSDMDRMLSELPQEVGTVDVLVNNAGFGDIAFFDRASWDKLQRLVRLNVEALLYLTFRLLPAMLSKGRGGILNISSAFGLTFMPAVGVYAGSKHFVTAFTESLRLDLVGTGVVVSQVCPGPVSTEFLDVAGNPVGVSVPGIIQITPERCARAALRGFAKGRALIVPGFVFKLVSWLARLTPRWLLRRVYGPLARYLRKKGLAA